MKDDDHTITEEDRHPLELYAQLTDDEFLYEGISEQRSHFGCATW